MIGSRSPILVATFSTTSGGAMPPTMRRTGSPGTTRNKVKMMSEVMKTIRMPCAIRLIRNSRINIEKGYPALCRTGLAGKPDYSCLPQQESGQRRFCHVLHSIRIDVETIQLLAVGMDENRREQRQRRRLARDGRKRFGLEHFFALLKRRCVAFLVENRVDLLVDNPADPLR